MEIKNERLIINENEIDEACEEIRQIVQDKLDELGHGNVIAQVEFYENCNDDLTLFWKELDIDLLSAEGFLGNIEYTTNGFDPCLVYENGKFEFYYVLTNSGNTCTSLKYMTNTGFCDFDKENDELLENILLEELNNKLNKE